MSGNGNHGTVNGATLGTDRHGVAGKAYIFDGVDDFIEVNDSTDFDFQDNDFSVLAWVKKFSQKNSITGVIMSQWNTGASPSSNEWIFTTTTTGQIGQPNFSVEIGNTNHKSVKPSYFNIGEWAQITGVRKDTDLYLYFNGNEVSKKENVIGSINETGRNLNFGKYRESDPIFSHISIDDAKIYDRALSADEISVLYNYEKPKLDLNDSNFQSAVNLWFTDELNATWTYGHISDWNVSAVTDMSNAFQNRSSFNENLNSWDVSSVTHMIRVFGVAQLTTSQWIIGIQLRQNGA